MKSMNEPVFASTLPVVKVQVTEGQGALEMREKNSVL
jgi:hypothetical protein